MWKEKLETALKAARGIAQKAQAEGRGLSAHESKTFDEHMAKAAEAREHLKAIAESDARYKAIAALGPDGPTDADGRKTGNALTFKGLARQIKSGMDDRGGFGVKSLLATGSQVTTAQTLVSPVTMGQPATSLLDLLPVRFLESGSEYSYLTQVTRTNNAAPVATGAVKPTSVYSLERVSRHLEVIAHLSEAIPEYWLADEAALAQFITTEMGYGLQLAVEEQALNGNGTSPNLLGVLRASGIQVQAFNTTKILTVRSAITLVESLGLTASGLAINPVDWEAIETAADGEDRFYLTPGNNPVDRAARRLWGVPVALTNQIEEGTSALLSEGCAGVVADRNINMQWGRTGDDFTRNLVRARLEGRFGVEVFRPNGVVQIDLTA